MTVLIAGKNRGDKEGFLNACREIFSTPCPEIIVVVERKSDSGTWPKEQSLAIIERLYEKEGVLAIVTGTYRGGKYYDALQSLEMAETWVREDECQA